MWKGKKEKKLYYYVCKLGVIFDPFCADIIYGSPLRGQSDFDGGEERSKIQSSSTRSNYRRRTDCFGQGSNVCCVHAGHVAFLLATDHFLTASAWHCWGRKKTSAGSIPKSVGIRIGQKTIRCSIESILFHNSMNENCQKE